jgi:hypothetical protein
MFFVVILAFNPQRVVSQAIPLSWRVRAHIHLAFFTNDYPQKPNITMSAADRVSFASKALGNAIDNLNSFGQFSNDTFGVSLPHRVFFVITLSLSGDPFGTTGFLYGQMAAFDIATNQTSYESTLQRYFALAQELSSNFSNPVYVSLAASTMS